MKVIQLDTQQRAPFTAGDDGYYYWTNTWFYDEDNPPDDITSWYWVAVALTSYAFECVEYVSGIRTYPVASGDYYGGGNQVGTPGAWSFSGGYSILNIARLSLRNNGREVGYKRLRLPIVAECMENGTLIKGDAVFMLEQVCATLEYAKLTTRVGLPIDEVTFSPRIHMWGLRHGTKRSARPVLPYP